MARKKKQVVTNNQPEVIDALTGQGINTELSPEDVKGIEAVEAKGGLLPDDYNKGLFIVDDPQIDEESTVSKDSFTTKQWYGVKPKYDWLKVNCKYIEGYTRGQLFFKNSSTKEYDSNVLKTKKSFDQFIEDGYEIHTTQFMPPDYILFIFRLPGGNK